MFDFQMFLVFLIPVQLITGITPDAAQGFRIATDLFMDSEYEEAREQYEVFLPEMEEFRGEALFRIGECEYNLREYEKALNRFRELWREYNDTYLAPEALYGMILSYIALEDWEQAKKTLLELASEYPGYKYAKKTLLVEAIIFFEQGDYREVIKKLEDIETQEALFYKAKSYFFLDDPIKALSILKKLTEEYPESPLSHYAYYYMGDVLFFFGDYEGALYKYNIFLERYPYSKLKDYARYKLAVCYFNEGEHLDAMENLKSLLNSSDKFLAAHSNLLFGESLMATGKFDDALTAYTRVISNFPDQRVGALASLKLGETFLKKMDTTGARIVYQQMASRYKSGEFAGFGDYLAGAQLFSEGRPLDAKDYFTGILKYYRGTQFSCAAIAMLLRTYNRMEDYGLSITLSPLLSDDFVCKEDDIWKGRAIFHLAEAYYQKSRYTKAKDLYRRITEQFNVSELLAPALTGLGWCLLHEERYDVAEKQFKRVISAYKGDTSSLISSLLGEGAVLYNRKEYEEALNQFESIPEIAPDNSLTPRAIFYTGRCYCNLEYYRQGMEAWERVLSQYHDADIAADAAYQIGQTYFQALKYDQAIAYFRLVIKEYPDSPLAPRAQAALGNSYYNSQDYRSAVREFSKLLTLYPEDTLISEAKQNLSSAYYMLGQEDPEALREFIRRFPEDPNAALAQFELGIDAYEKGEYKVAIEEFRKVIVDFPETNYAEDAEVNILKIYEETKEFEDLVRESERFIEYFPESTRTPLALFYKGLGYFQLNNYEKAIDAFERIVREYPESEYTPSARYNLSQAYKQTGELEKAVDELKTYASTKGESFEAHILSGVTYQEKANYKEALEVYLGLKPESLPEKAELYARKGKCLAELGRREEAIQEYTRLIPLKLQENNYQMKGLAELAALYESKNNIRKAIEVYSRLLEVTTDENLKVTVNERLSYLKSKGD